MIADAREMSMVQENRLFIVDARASADTLIIQPAAQAHASAAGFLS
jgi:hypothetical protein